MSNAKQVHDVEQMIASAVTLAGAVAAYAGEMRRLGYTQPESLHAALSWQHGLIGRMREHWGEAPKEEG